MSINFIFGNPFLGDIIREGKLKNDFQCDIERMLLTADLATDKDAHLDIDLADYPNVCDSDQIFQVGNNLNIAMKIKDNHVLVYYNKPANEANALIDKDKTYLLKLIQHHKIFSSIEWGSFATVFICGLITIFINILFKMNRVELWIDLLTVVIVMFGGLLAVTFCICELINEYHIRLEHNKQIKNAKTK